MITLVCGLIYCQKETEAHDDIHHQATLWIRFTNCFLIDGLYEQTYFLLSFNEVTLFTW